MSQPAVAPNTEPSKDLHPFKQLAVYADSHAWRAYLGCLLAALNGVLTVVPFVLVWYIIRNFILVAPYYDQASDVAPYAWGAFAAVVAGSFLYFCALMMTHNCAFRIASNMRKTCINHLDRVSLGLVDQTASGNIRRIIDISAGQTEDLIAHKLPDFVASIVAPIAYIICMFLFDPIMGAVCLIPIVISIAALSLMFTHKADGEDSSFMELYQNALTRMSEAGTEYVRGIPVLKMFQQTVYSCRAFHEAIISYRDMATKYTIFCRVPQVSQLVAINGTFAIIVPVSILLAAHATDFKLFVIDFLFYALFSSLTTSVMNKVMYASETIELSKDAIVRVQSILEMPIMKRATEEETQRPQDSSLTLEQVCFSYPGANRNALNNVSLSIAPGQTVAIVGESGGGKSTLASLFPRFWDASSGRVLVGGVDVRHIEPSVLMDSIACVFQNDHLLKQSIRDNIRAGRIDARDADIEAAAHAAQCDDIIAKMPQGLDTIIGTHGVYLSGGERQRIALARAILKDAPIIVLDEATAFADPENEALIQQAFAKLCHGKTVLMIAHRLSTVMHADCIYVMEQGQLVEQGTHETLLQANGRYAQLWKNYQASVSWKIGGTSYVA
ncbi:ABC transporter ATP-binding protein/permease [Collinsella sp. zg1085]|uniref:ABC transporter ATP-binding protein n=1 Tax=Collinsella sp. zg1085 TaxID=2844380 RepID=UPI001C0C02C5|nr:ABC transporter ATP-binding protein [Collinsella sp. zg1085]QWT17841.1 ABC transporter ATP-binding protein/permease [Collinsella sp. zg1085]